VPSSSVRAWFLEEVEAEQARLRSYIRALGVRAEAVDDLAQDTLIIALEKLDGFDRGGDFGAWVRQIARRLVANERRKQARRNQILSDHVTDLLLEIDREAPHPGDGPGFGDELVALRECMTALPKDGRELLQQRYFEDLSPGTIGSRLGRPSNQVRQTLLRLRRALLECIERRMRTFVV
jgi:RNA polymerase sigma-70 factor (ECF subfamily)